MYTASAIIIPVKITTAVTDVPSGTIFDQTSRVNTNLNLDVIQTKSTSRINHTEYSFKFVKVTSNIVDKQSTFDTEKYSTTMINVSNIHIFDDYYDLSRSGVNVYSHYDSTLITDSYSMTFIYNSKFPDLCESGNIGYNENTERLIDKTDNNLIIVGSEIRHVVYGKYYPCIYQFDKEFLSRVGTDFKVEGLDTHSIEFDTSDYRLTGVIPFTNTKHIKFIINDTYKFTLTLIVDVREEFEE